MLYFCKIYPLKLCIEQKAVYSAFESTLISSIVSYRKNYDSLDRLSFLEKLEYF